MVGRNQEAPGTPPCSPKRGPGLGSQVSKGHEGFSLEQLSWASVPPPPCPHPQKAWAWLQIRVKVMWMSATHGLSWGRRGPIGCLLGEQTMGPEATTATYFA